MKPILTPAESSALDRASRDRGIEARDLMERAGAAVARAALDLVGGAYGRRAVVVCGKGNNGGDGLVAARHLARRGARVTVVMLEDPADLREPASGNFDRLSEVDARVRPFSAGLLSRELQRADVAVDAIFGTGFRGIPEDEFAAAIAILNEADVPVVAVDIPSGVNGETAAIEGEAVWAAVTVTFGALKPGLVLLPGAEGAGIIEVADIGFPPDLVGSDLVQVEEEDVAGLLPIRQADAHKRSTGVVLVVGGSRRMTGAVRLVAEAAYRGGAGLVTLAVPEGILDVVRTGVVEATFLPLAETPDGTVAVEAMEGLAERLGEVDVVAVGPGMTAQPETARLVGRLVGESHAPLVVDADGLNAFAGRAGDLAGRRAEAVITPHAGEAARLLGASAREVSEDRVGHARKLAAITQATTLLKGYRTLVASADGQVRVNPTGGPVLATAGTGDVLTGLVAALLARGLTGPDAAVAGAYLHGLAGSLAGLELGEGVTAGDLLGRIPRAWGMVAWP